MLPCLDQPQRIVVSDPDPELRELLVRERDRMGERIAFLERSRESLIQYIEAMDRSAEEPRGLAS
jgi:hypothetical protein